MDNLRLILLIIGCLMVMGIYLWEVLYKETSKKRADILNAVDDTPDSPVSLTNNHESTLDDYSPEAALADLGSLLTQSRNQDVRSDELLQPFNIADTSTLLDEEDENLPLNMSVKDYENSLSEDDESDVFAAIEEEVHAHEDLEEKNNLSDETEANQEEAEVPQSNQDSGDILVLYITSPSHISFNGLSISKAADEVGMIYGHMNIFHHFGPGKMHSGQPLFSLANMHEPGSFDLGRMADLKTKGLAVFMYSPASIDASVVFELFLNTTQRIAELLGGKVRTSDNEILNNAAISSLREKAGSLSTS